MLTGSRKYLLIILIWPFLPIFMSGCSVVAAKLIDDSTQRTDWTQLRRANYAAADNLFQTASNNINTTQSLHLIRLNNLGATPESGVAPISWFIPQQVGNRLAQLGVNVIQPSTVPTAKSGESQANAMPLQIMKSEAIQAPQKRLAGRLYLEGDYVRLEDDLVISLRLIEGKTNRLLSTIEYDIEMNSDIYALTSAQTDSNRLFEDGWMQF